MTKPNEPSMGDEAEADAQRLIWWRDKGFTQDQAEWAHFGFLAGLKRGREKAHPNAIDPHTFAEKIRKEERERCIRVVFEAQNEAYWRAILNPEGER